MAYVPLKFPPGVFRNGTEYQAKGRYHDANLVRWFEETMRPVGGWVARTTEAMTGAARCLLTWKDNSGGQWIAVGTHTNLYAFTRSATSPFDITPAGYVAGRADASIGGGYGSGDYGSSTYGTVRTDSSNILDASVWTLDTFGQDLVGCVASDGKVYVWTTSGGNPTSVPAAQVTNAPTNCRGVVVTEERFLFALGAGGVPRRVQWADQETLTTWTPSGTNQAGDFDLQTPGRLMCGKRVKGATLLLTDVDAHIARYIGPPLVYGFERVGTGCGAISQQAVAVIDSQAVWMSQNGFWLYNGYVQPLPCDVQDFVFSTLSATQFSKVYAVHNSSFGEVWWFYPSTNSVENDRYVLWNYRENHWSIGALSRLSGTDRGVFNMPIMVGPDGKLYNHETGNNYGGLVPYAETGPLEIGEGDNVLYARKLVPDEKTLGDVTASFKVRFYPEGAETVFGPYTLTQNTDVRFAARQVSIVYTSSRNTDWRVGVPRLEGVMGGER